MSDNTTIQQDQERWVDLEEAVTLTGLARTSLLKKIQKGSFGPNKTRKVPGIKSSKWQIAVSALDDDARLAYWAAQSKAALDVTIEGIVTDQAKVPPEPPTKEAQAWAMAGKRQQNAALKNEAMLKEWLALEKTNLRRAWCKQNKVTMATLYNYRKAYNNHPASLIKKAGHPKGRVHSSGAVRDFVRQLYLQPQAFSAAAVIRATEAQFGDACPHRATIHRWLVDRAFIPDAEKTMARQGEEEYRKKHAPKFSRNWTRIAPNDTWVGDHHPLDIMCITPKGTVERPWITAWQDAHSRAFAGYVMTFSPNGQTIGEAFRQGILPKEGNPVQGMPKQVLVDNGKDYKSIHLNGETVVVYRQTEAEPVWGLFRVLGVETRFCTPRSPWTKPVERLFGTIAGQYMKVLPGYLGNKPEHRPAGLMDDVNATRKWLKSGKTKGACKLLQWWEVEEIVAEIVECYNNRPHRALHDKTPAQVWDEHRGAILMPNKDTLDLLVLRSCRRVIKLSNEGITLTFPSGPHETCKYMDSQLYPYDGRPVEVRYDPRDRSSVLVIIGEKVFRVPKQEARAPFAETPEEIVDLQERQEIAAHLRKEIRDRVRALVIKNPLLMTWPKSEPFTSSAGGDVLPMVTSYVRKAANAKKALAEPTPEQADAVNGQLLRLWSFQQAPRRDA